MRYTHRALFGMIATTLFLFACEDESSNTMTGPIVVGEAGEEMNTEQGGESSEPEGEMNAECQRTCEVLLECGWTLDCDERTLSDARSSCLSLCGGERAEEITSLAGKTCAETQVTLPELLGISESCERDLCAEQSCSAAERCDSATGQCVDLCADVSCDLGEVCAEGTCVDRCAEVSCSEGEACDSSEGRCVPACDLVECAQGERCDPETAQCVNLCEGVECAEGLGCDGASGECVDLCAECGWFVMLKDMRQHAL